MYEDAYLGLWISASFTFVNFSTVFSENIVFWRYTFTPFLWQEMIKGFCDAINLRERIRQIITEK